jgi:glucose/mannose transport system substrate-binding protein
VSRKVRPLLALSLVFALLLAACKPATPTASPTPPTPEEPGGELEIFSWWTAGGEAEGLAAMLEIFQEQYPDVEIINATVAGGAGVDARAVLATRMQGGDPPGSFQVHAGHELIDTYVVAGQMEPVTFLYEQEGWIDKYPSDLIDILSYDGEIWSVPVNIHRANVLWYNKAIFEDNNLEPPATMADFFTVAATLKAAGITPLALGESWTVVHLFETVLLGSLGPDAYAGLWTGETDWGSAEVTTALNNFDRMLNYVNEDFAALSWDQATQLVIDGTAAMNIMGDWAEGYFKAQGWTPGVEFGWAPSPGSAGAFDALSDSFGLPKDAANRDAAIAWLSVCGSVEGQDAFNPIKGSIPAHTDADRSLYDEYLQSALDDFASDAIVPSVMHGAAAAPSWQQDIIDAVGLFVSDRDTGTFHEALVSAAPVGASAPPEVGGELEVFSWWTAGGEAEGLAAMLEIFQEQYPDVEIINATVAGGAGVDARAVLATRMQGGDPPGSFQVHAGHELIDTYVVADQMEPVTFLYEQEGWIDKYPSDLIDILSYDGEIWSVPVNIHRANVLWYNKAIFEDNNLEPPATMADFFTVAATLEAAGITPLSLGESWTVVHLFETVLLGSLGPDAYAGLWTGETDWGSAEVTTALNNFDRMLNYVNEDFAALSWDQATQLVIDGTAAMNIMGDWAEGYFKAQGWTPGVEFGWAPSPGSAGAFDALSDSFGLPKDAANRDAAIAWLSVCGSVEGQDAFNPIKGSIPAHTDADRSLYDEYLQSALDDFASDAIVPSVMHGAAAAPSWQQDIIDAVGLFVGDRDVAAFQDALVAAAQ